MLLCEPLCKLVLITATDVSKFAEVFNQSFINNICLCTSYCKRSDYDAVYIFRAFDETLSRSEQINESSSSVNVITDSCVENLIPKNDGFFPKRDTLLIGT